MEFVHQPVGDAPTETEVRAKKLSQQLTHRTAVDSRLFTIIFHECWKNLIGCLL